MTFTDERSHVCLCVCCLGLISLEIRYTGGSQMQLIMLGTKCTVADELMTTPSLE